MANRVVDVARTYLNTPFHHQARLKGVGIDCIGLVVCVAKELGITVEDRTDYSDQPDGVTLIQKLEENLDCLPLEDLQPGDIVAIWFSNKKHPQHVAIVSDVGLIHTYSHVGKVVEHRINDVWRNRLHSGYRFKWQQSS